MKRHRRNLLKALSLGGGAATVTQLPKIWSQPVIEAVALPAHAQTTETEGFFGSGPVVFIIATDGANSERFAFESNIPLLDSVAPRAEAGEFSIPVEIQCAFSGGPTSYVASLSTDLRLKIYLVDYGPVSDATPSVLDPFVNQAHAQPIAPPEACYEGVLSTSSYSALTPIDCESPFGAPVEAMIESLGPDGATGLLRFQECLVVSFQVSRGTGTVPCSCRVYDPN